MLASSVQRPGWIPGIAKKQNKQQQTPTDVFTMRAASEVTSWVILIYYHVRNAISKGFTLKTCSRSVAQMKRHTLLFVDWEFETASPRALHHCAVCPGPQPCFSLKNCGFQTVPSEGRYGGTSLNLQNWKGRGRRMECSRSYTAILCLKWMNICFEKAFEGISTNNPMSSSKPEYICKKNYYISYLRCL